MSSDVEKRPVFDPQLHRDVVEDAVRGRKIENYRKALTTAGFRYYPPDRLDAWNDGRPKTEGEWRYQDKFLRLALTDQNVIAWFETPKHFWAWFRQQVIRSRAQGRLP